MTTVTIKATQIVRHFLNDASWINSFSLKGNAKLADREIDVEVVTGSAQIVENDAIHYSSNFDSYSLILTVHYDDGQEANYKIHK